MPSRFMWSGKIFSTKASLSSFGLIKTGVSLELSTLNEIPLFYLGLLSHVSSCYLLQNLSERKIVRDYGRLCLMSYEVFVANINVILKNK